MRLSPLSAATTVYLGLTALPALAQPRFVSVSVPNESVVMNDSGVVAGIARDPSTVQRVFVFNSRTGVRTWYPAVAHQERVVGINNNNEVLVALTDDYGSAIVGPAQVTLTDSIGVGHWHAYALNDFGTLGGYRPTTPQGGTYEPVVAQRLKGNLYSLAPIPGVSSLQPFRSDYGMTMSAIVTSVSNTGFVAGFGSPSNRIGNPSAFVYERATGQLSLMGPSDGSQVVNAFSVNNSGHAVGRSSHPVTIVYHAVFFYRWEFASPPVYFTYDLEQLAPDPNLEVESVARSINDQQAVVGYRGSRGFYFTWDDGVRELSGLVNWGEWWQTGTITDAYRINNQGEILADYVSLWGGTPRKTVLRRVP